MGRQMKIFDISWPISTATTGYKDKNVVAIQTVKDFNRDGARETTITLSSHTGTHVDAPAHFLKDGKSIDEILPDRTIGECVVIDCSDCSDAITYEDLEERLFSVGEDDIVLLKTTNSDRLATDPFDPHFVYLHESGARFLAEKRIKAVGIDYLGIERGQPDHQTHTTLMHADIVVIEGLRLQAVKAGHYLLICLPLNVIGTEAAPARAILIKNSDCC
jgi:arylformamidase